MSDNRISPPTLRLREQDLASKIAVVTGASRGIGRAICANLASRGCSILGTCSSSDSIHFIDTLADEIAWLYSGTENNNPPKIVGAVANMSTPDCPTIIAHSLIENFGAHVDIYINNAAPREIAKVGTLTAAHIQNFCLSNIQNPALIVDELVKRKMFRKASRIVFLSSGRSRKPSHFMPMYCAVKSAGESLVRCWADAFGSKDPEFDFMSGTTANSVLVGLTATETIMSQGKAFLDKAQEEFFPLMSMPRIAQPEDVADVAGLLCGNDAR